MASKSLDELLGIREPIKKLTLAEYFQTVPDEEFNSKVTYLFGPYLSSILHIRHNFGLSMDDPIPEIMVLRSDEISVETVFGGRIEMSDAFISKCLDAEIPKFREVTAYYADDMAVETLAPAISMMWTYCHEYIHHARKHNDVFDLLKEMEGDGFDERLTAYALERDADLCAISIVYRYLQAHYDGAMNDLMLRQLVLFLVFWSMRPYLSIEHGDDHLSMGVRLMDIALKLASLIENTNESSQHVPNEIDTDTEIRIVVLVDTIKACENIFMNKFDKSEGKLTIQALINQGEYDLNSTLLKVVDRWEVMRSVITQVSGTEA